MFKITARKLRSLCFKSLSVATIMVGFAASANALVINASLTVDDFLTDDATGEFYYDIYNITPTSSDDITIDMTSSDFEVFSIFWDHSVLPSATWTEGALSLYDVAIAQGDDQGALGTPTTLTIFSPTIGQLYQFSAATFQYNPTALGDYTLSFTTLGTDPNVQAVAVVPAPAGLGLIAAGLVLLGLTRRRA